MSPATPNVESASEREVFLAALELDDLKARADYLNRLGTSDPALRDSVASLLAHHDRDEFLESPALRTARASGSAAETANRPDSVLAEQPGDQLGPYRLLQEIGEGGGGVVYLAEQQSPLRRQVALKVLRPGTDTRSVIARFEQERQALALMDHPNIARVFDAGTTAAGRPFFVMELVRGIKITEFADAENLTPRERIELLIPVCHAVQHAHQKGVIHRDIKPSNILVTLHDGVAIPKVIDFGIAKAVGSPLTDKTLFTDFRIFLGTPAYTSPEQADLNSVDVDTRTDIYSLGVLLYELLTGTTPFDPRQLAASGFDELRRTIRETEPDRPSTRLRALPNATVSTAAQRRQTEPARLIGLMRGDLDWIVMKCLEKDRNRRYDSAAALAAELQRYLDNEPVLARPPSRAYRFGRFVRRHRGAFVGGVAVALAMMAGILASSWQAYRAKQAEQEQARLRVLAEQARAAEAELRTAAQAQELSARRRAYAADINLLQQALDVRNFGRARRLLDSQRPLPGQEDVRGWEWRYLWQLCRSEAEFTLCQRSKEVHSLAASADGRFLTAAETDGGVSIWDLAQRRPVLDQQTGTGRTLITSSPTAAVFAFTESDYGGPAGPAGRIRVWDTHGQRFLADVRLQAPCLSLRFSPDGADLVTLTADGVIARHPITGGNARGIARIPLRPGDGRTATLSPDLRLAAYNRDGNRIAVADAATGLELWNAEATRERLTAVTFTPDGSRLATGAGFTEADIRLWDVAAGLEVARLEGHRNWIGALAFSPDGATLASASADQTIALWDVAGAAQPSASDVVHGLTPVLQPKRVLRGHQLEVWSLSWLNNGRRLASGAKDGTVLIWDLTQPAGNRPSMVVPGAFMAWAFDGDRPALLTLDRNGTVARWSGEELQHSTILVEGVPNLFFPRLSGSGRYLAGGTREGAIRIWSLPHGDALPELKHSDGPVAPIAFLPQSDRLLTQRWMQPEFHVWDVATGQRLQTWRITTSPGPFVGRAVAVTEAWLALLNEDGTGHLLNLKTGRVTELRLALKQLVAAALSPNGSLLAAVSRFGVGGLWEIPSGTRAATYSGVLQAMVSATFSPTGQRLAIGSDGAEAITLWDLAGHQELLTLAGDGAGFAACAFSSDGSLLAAGNRDGRLHVWRAPTWAEIRRVESAAAR